MSDYSTDVTIIGAGPVGLFSIFTCGMARLSCTVIDALDTIGGQLTALYPEKPIFDIPGYPRILATDLISQLEKQASPFHPIFSLGKKAEGLQEGKSKHFLITTADGSCFESRVLIIAAGVGAFGPHKPHLAGLESFEGKSVFYMVRRLEDFRGKHVIIAGGGDTAVDWALALVEVARHVTVVHRREKFRAIPTNTSRLQQLAKTGKLTLMIPYHVKVLEGHHGKISAVIVATIDGREKRRLEADILLLLFGLEQKLGPIAEWGLQMDGHNHIVTDQTTGMTNKRGIFAVGDVTTYQGKLKLILAGFAEAALAARSARAIIYPNEPLHLEHSTTTGVPVM